MPPIVVTTPHDPARAERLATALGATVQPGPGGRARLRVGPDAAPADVQALLARLRPLRIAVESTPAVSGIVLDAGDAVQVDAPVSLYVPAPWRRHAFLTALAVDGPVRFVATRPPGSRRPTPAALLMAAAMPQEDWAVAEQDGKLILSASARVCGAVMPGIEIEVEGDAAALRQFHSQELALREEGWIIHTNRVRTPAPAAELWFPPGVDGSVAEALGASVPALRPAVAEGFRAHVGTTVRVRLPRAASPAESARSPHVLVRTDAPDEAGPFVDALKSMGIPTVDVVLGLSFSDGFALRHTARVRRGATVDDVERLVERHIDALGLTGAHRCNVLRVEELGGPATMEIDLPCRMARDGRLMTEVMSHVERYTIKLANLAQPRELQRALEDALHTASARNPRIGELSSRQEEYRIAIGGAPWEIAQVLACTLKVATGVDLPIQRVWGARDTDIWISVPPGTRMRAPEAPAPQGRPAARASDRTFLEVGETAVRVGTVTLPRHQGHPLAPSPESYAHTCVDAPTGVLLAHLALSVRLREPVLLEGPTAAGKTSGVLFLAALLGQPVVRVNLSGQTDTGELIGRYAPSPAGWAWQEGVIPSAMRHGWWVVLDELNLAEPAIVERLNPVLERVPALVLTEGDGTRFGPGGLPVAPGFHVFATMNPADGAYAGRNGLSPALRDRFTAQLQCGAPSEGDLRDLLGQLVHGAGPDLTVGATRWRGATGLDAPHAALAAYSGIDALLAAYARFHASVDAAASAADTEQRLGGDRREGVVVSRRVILAVLDFLCHAGPDADLPAALAAAIDRYYLARVATEPDRDAIRHLAHAAGLGAIRRAA